MHVPDKHLKRKIIYSIATLTSMEMNKDADNHQTLGDKKLLNLEKIMLLLSHDVLVGGKTSQSCASLSCNLLSHSKKDKFSPLNSNLFAHLSYIFILK